MNLLYLVHDLGDAAVQRRRRFFRDGGALVSLVGFSRQTSGAPGPDADGRSIGKTRNGHLLQRVASMTWAMIAAGRWGQEVRSADVVVARSLEMLVIATVVRRRAGSGVPVVYECLDIHRLMTGTGLLGTLLRALERRLLRSCSLLVVSSEMFIEAYFSRYHSRLPRWMLLENKLLLGELGGSLPDRSTSAAIADGPPWRIGWFGIIRCRRSLQVLAALVASSDGAVEVEIRGRPAYDVVPEFDAVIAATPGMTFGGAYDRATDLATLYGGVHFTWAIDYYEDGLNSAWLLPNRLYEGSMFGSVPLALAHVETGRWLARHGCGLRLDEPLERTLAALFAAMTAPAYRDARQRVVELDPASLMETPATAAAFVVMLSQLRTASRVAEPALIPARTT